MPKDRIVIMEGPDCSGKSTIGKELARLEHLEYFRFDGQHDMWRKGQFETALRFDQPYLLQLLQQTRLKPVIDRAWPSEYVYSGVMKRDTDIPLIWRLDEEYAKLRALIVICVRRSYDGCRDDLVYREKLDDLRQEYAGFFQICKTPAIMIYTDDFDCSIEKQIPIIQEAMYTLDRMEETCPEIRFKMMLSSSRRPGTRTTDSSATPGSPPSSTGG